MRRYTTILTVVLSIVLAGAAMAQVRGKGRMQGTVVEKGTGKAIANATVTIAPSNGSTTPIVVKTNAKGRWSALGLTGGQWNVDIAADGFTTSRGTANVSEVQMLPPITTELAAEVKQEEAPAVKTAPSVPQEAVDAVNNGQALLAEGKAKEAVVELEKAETFLPDNMQLKQVLAQAYYKAGDLKKAISTLEKVTAADPSDTTTALLLTNVYLEDGQLDAAKTLLGKLPADAVKDPTVYTNIGILFLNKTNPAEAATYFSKAVAMDATRADSYYYRGLAEVQLKKNAEAKADFQKVLELSPDSPEGHDAKQLLAGLK